MRNDRFRRLRGVAAAALTALTAVAPNQAAAFIVFDPSNYAQNVLTAARTLEQVRNQILELENQAKMLAKNPLQLSPGLAQSINEARALFEAAQGLAYDARRIGDEVKTLYPEAWSQYNLDEVLAQSDQWLAQSRASLETAMAAEARAAAGISRSRDAIGAALQSSHGAEGETAAVQAGNQLLGVEAAQLVEIHALLVAQGRALASERMETLAREARASEIRRRAFPSAAPPSPAPARSAF